MAKPPSVDIFAGKIPLSPSPLSEFSDKELKDALIDRGCVDFSKWEVLIKLSPFILLLGMGTLWKASQALDGTYLGCLLQ